MTRATLSLLLLFAGFAVGQTRPSPRDFVQEIMPNGVPTELNIPSAQERPHAIELLKAAQVEARGKRAQQVSFLLAALGSDYSANRRFLVQALRGCDARSIQDCDEDTAAFVIGLYQRGDKTLLRLLLKTGLKSDGALSEVLGDFYADVLTKKTTEFLNALAPFSPPDQQSLCTLAGGRDGGGMAPEELHHLQTRLRAIGTDAALRCLSAAEAINKKIESAR